jgi:hypothetical protein
VAGSAELAEETLREILRVCADVQGWQAEAAELERCCGSTAALLEYSQRLEGVLDARVALLGQLRDNLPVFRKKMPSA